MEDLEAAVVEIRQLRGEIKKLSRQVADFERSRWWRSHPRFLTRRSLQRVRRWRGHRSAAPDSVMPPTVSPPQAHPLIARFEQEVVSRGRFSHHWFQAKIPSWEVLLQQLEGRAANILEIGSFEGFSACYLLWRLPDASLTCVDTFAEGSKHPSLDGMSARTEVTFDGNVRLVDASRVRKIVADSRRALLDLALEQPRFDFIYIDGSHLGLDVIVDAALSWPLLADDGALVFDDYTWDVLGRSSLRRPGPAIDAFLTLIEGNHRLLWKGSQVALRKVASSWDGP
jgi:Methyltransferase domain